MMTIGGMEFRRMKSRGRRNNNSSGYHPELPRGEGMQMEAVLPLHPEEIPRFPLTFFHPQTKMIWNDICIQLEDNYEVEQL